MQLSLAQVKMWVECPATHIAFPLLNFFQVMTRETCRIRISVTSSICLNRKELEPEGN